MISVFSILIVIALILAVVDLIKPQRLLLRVAIILVCVALLIARRGF